MEYTIEEQKKHRAVYYAALRSGKYSQCKNMLHGNGYFCCLGVACDIAKDDLGIEWVKMEEPDKPYLFGDEGGVLPPDVQDYYGFPQANPYLTIGDSAVTDSFEASYLNDAWELSFNKIADAFERTFPAI
jgi:hypothetical protein